MGKASLQKEQGRGKPAGSDATLRRDRHASATATDRGKEALGLGSALARDPVLAALLQRQRESNQRLQSLRECLDHPLLAQLTAGPLDDSRWVLLVADSAAAAKLKHLLPRMQQVLLSAGWPSRELKLKLRRQSA
jgi:hypothetical protein